MGGETAAGLGAVRGSTGVSCGSSAGSGTSAVADGSRGGASGGSSVVGEGSAAVADSASAGLSTGRVVDEGKRTMTSDSGRQRPSARSPTTLAEYRALVDRPRTGYIGLANWQGEAKGMAFRNIRIKGPEPRAK